MNTVIQEKYTYSYNLVLINVFPWVSGQLECIQYETLQELETSRKFQEIIRKCFFASHLTIIHMAYFLNVIFVPVDESTSKLYIIVGLMQNRNIETHRHLVGLKITVTPKAKKSMILGKQTKTS